MPWISPPLRQSLPPKPAVHGSETSQLSPVYPCAQSQPQFSIGIVPVASPPFWHGLPPGPMLHAAPEHEKIAVNPTSDICPSDVNTTLIVEPEVGPWLAVASTL